jgi:hypothetical protein
MARGPKRLDLTGQKFGLLVAKYIDPDPASGKSSWLCDCDCGTTGYSVLTVSLRSGNTRSCGCLVVEGMKKRATTHGAYQTKEYKAWLELKSRCTNGNIPRFKDYGGRQIEVCEEWLNSFEQFLADVGPSPSEAHSLDRPDVNGPYSPTNARWATREEQDNNKTNSVFIEYGGRRQTIARWAAETGIPYGTIRARYVDASWPAGEALGFEKRKQRHGTLPADIAQNRRAQASVRQALEAGELVKPSRCQHAGCRRPDVICHHPNGHGPGHELDVAWYCRGHFPKKYDRPVTCHGITRPVREWARELGLSRRALLDRLDKYDVETALALPRGGTGYGRRKEDLTGRTFGRWTVLGPGEKGGRYPTWRCQCSCPAGTVKDVPTRSLTRGGSKSCGCYRRDVTAAMGTTHGLSKSAEYACWKSVRNRCTNPNDEAWPEYGGRTPPITICERWEKSFDAFYQDLGPMPAPGLTVDRIKNHLGYEPWNCRWATRKEQTRNRRKTVLVTWNDETRPLGEWAERQGIAYLELYRRLFVRKWPVDRAMTEE